MPFPIKFSRISSVLEVQKREAFVDGEGEELFQAYTEPEADEEVTPNALCDRGLWLTPFEYVPPGLVAPLYDAGISGLFTGWQHRCRLRKYKGLRAVLAWTEALGGDETERTLTIPAGGDWSEWFGTTVFEIEDALEVSNVRIYAGPYLASAPV